MKSSANKNLTQTSQLETKGSGVQCVMMTLRISYFRLSIFSSIIWCFPKKLTRKNNGKNGTLKTSMGIIHVNCRWVCDGFTMMCISLWFFFLIDFLQQSLRYLRTAWYVYGNKLNTGGTLLEEFFNTICRKNFSA